MYFFWKHWCNCTCSSSLSHRPCTTVNGTCCGERLILTQLSYITAAPQWLQLPEVMMLSSGLCDTLGQKVLVQQARSWGCCIRLWANSRRCPVHVCKRVCGHRLTYSGKQHDVKMICVKTSMMGSKGSTAHRAFIF